MFKTIKKNSHMIFYVNFMAFYQNFSSPSYLMIDHFNVEILDEFELLGITIDHNLFFNKYVARLKSSVN